MAKVKFFVQLRVRVNSLARGGFRIENVSAQNLTQSMPLSLAEGMTRVVEVMLEIPDELLIPIEVSATLPKLQLAKEYEAILRTIEGEDE